MNKGTQYQRDRIKKALIVDKLKQLTVYRKGLEDYIYSPEYFSLSTEVQERMCFELVLINNWTELHKDLKLR